jgi:hypothetical protein
MINSYFSRNTLLKGILPGLVLSIVELLLEFVWGLRSIWILENLVLLTIFNLLGQAIWRLVLAIRREVNVCIAAFCMLLVYVGLSRLSWGVYPPWGVDLSSQAHKFVGAARMGGGGMGESSG